MIVAVYKGQVPERLSATEWLRRQSKATQNDILGDAKGEMFRQGTIAVDKLVDFSGRTFNIQELTTGIRT